MGEAERDTGTKWSGAWTKGFSVLSRLTNPWDENFWMSSPELLRLDGALSRYTWDERSRTSSGGWFQLLKGIRIRN